MKIFNTKYLILKLGINHQSSKLFSYFFPPSIALKLSPKAAIFYFLLFTFHFALSQPKSIPDKVSIRTGEAIHVQLFANATTAGDQFILPDSIPHFDIWEKNNALQSGDTLRQNITITSYDSGQFIFPAIKVLGTKTNVQTNPITINVQPVNIDSLKDYHDIKDIIEVPPTPIWPYIVGGIILLALQIWLVYFILKKTGIIGGKKYAFEAKGNPYQTALEQIKQLQKDAEKPTATASFFYTQLSFIYRGYLAKKLGWYSFQQTGTELVKKSESILNVNLLKEFTNVVSIADAAKFAKQNPEKPEWKNSLESIKIIIEHIEMNGVKV